MKGQTFRAVKIGARGRGKKNNLAPEEAAMEFYRWGGKGGRKRYLAKNLLSFLYQGKLLQKNFFPPMG